MSELERRGEPQPAGPTAAELQELAKVAAATSLRVGAWAAVTGLTAGRRAVDVVRHPEHARELADDLRTAANAITQALVGENGRSEPLHRPVVTPPVERIIPAAVVHEPTVNPLHQAGQELLRRSRDVWSEDRGHPAYARIIEELAPDEARILVLLLKQGPQPSLDVRTGGLMSPLSSTLVAGGLNMIGARAGCRYLERVPSYLHNLERLGLVWFSRETVRDLSEYQVLEAQPDVRAATDSVRRARIVRRSIHLTPFGEDFCRDGLGLDLSDEEQLSIPRHASPTTD